MMEIISGIVQHLAVLVSTVGVFVLIRKEQTKASSYLLMANVACLLLNFGYLLVLSSTTGGEGLLAYKVEYLGNVMFYLFFILFLTTYFGRKISEWPFYIWMCLEGLQLSLVWFAERPKKLSEQFKKLEDMGNMVFEDIEFTENAAHGLVRTVIQKGIVYEIRYAMISMLLLCCLLFTIYVICRSRSKREKSNYRVLGCAELIILASLVLEQTTDLTFNVVPVSAAAAITLIIFSVIRGQFHVEDMGREWLFEDMKDVFIVVDNGYGFVDANAAAMETFPSLKYCVTGSALPCEVRPLFMEKEKEIEIHERRHYKKLVPIEDKGVVKGYGVLLTDVHDQHILMEELKAQKVKAEEANEAKSAFMSTMSHEIRTPMNAIVGMTDILLRSPLPEREKEYMTNIKSSGEALLSIINDILDFSKIESGKLEIIEEKYDLMSTLNDLSMIFLNRIAEKPVELLFDLDKDLPSKYFGDGLRIRQVIINLVNNAIKFTEEGCIRLKIEQEKREGEQIWLRFRVIDSGQGIKQEDIERLFASFEQVDKQKNKHKEGTGLGLSISRQLVELMGGSIRVTSEYGKGSEFSFVLPQKVLKEEPAAALKDSEVKVISGCMKNDWSGNMLEELCRMYGQKFIPHDDAHSQKVDYFFTDQIYQIPQECWESFREQGTTVCVVQNPMVDASWDQDAVIINKPLYTANFCQVLNNETVRPESVQEKLMCFMAPQAKILLVDDNEMNLKVALGLLEPLKMQFTVATDGKQALEKIQKETFDLVFMDHMMPVMDGIEAVKCLRQMEGEYYQNLPVIALTANAVSGAKEEFLQAGMNDFAAKPIRLKEICKLLHKWLPKDKIQQGEEPAAVAEVQPEADFSIEGLDVSEGILNCGTKELFLNLLGDFHDMIDWKSELIETYLQEGKIRDYTIEVHALKNTARMIGAMKLSADFYRLEQKGNQNLTEELEAETLEVLKLFRSYKPILEPYAGAEEQKKEVDKEVLVGLLLKVKNDMDVFDIDGADEAFRELERCELPESMGTQMMQLKAYMADVAMEQVMELAQQMAYEVASL